MNPRRVHELMLQHFPKYDASTLEWSNLLGRDGVRVEALMNQLESLFGNAPIVIEVHRRLGTVLQAGEAATYVAAHIGEGDIRIADREFTTFCVVARNGVSACWAVSANRSIQGGPAQTPAADL